MNVLATSKRTAVVAACAEYQEKNLRNLRVRWTWPAIDADIKLIISYMLGDRGIHTAMAFMPDLAKRTVNRFQPTMEAGLTDRVWSLEELTGLIETSNSQPASLGEKFCN